MFRRSFMMFALAACQGSSAQQLAEPPAAQQIEARDAKGAVIADLRAGHPCRASIGPIEMLIGGQPLVAQNGSVRWSGETVGARTTISRDGEPIASIAKAGTVTSVLDPHGVPVVRITDSGDISSSEGRLVRRVVHAQGGLQVATPEGTLVARISGAHDGDTVLVALLTASELPPELRMLTACSRVP